MGMIEPDPRGARAGGAPLLRRLGLIMAVAAVALLACPVARAESSSDERPSRRSGWATLLVTYVGLGALATGGAYLLRDNFVGRSLAVTAGGWGGASLGAGAA